MTLFLRGGFVLAVLSALVFALIPASAEIVFFRSDKEAHFAAFCLCAFLGMLGWPSRRGVVAAGLLGLGVLIELAQGTALIHRDMDAADIVADAAGIAAGWLCAVLWRPEEPPERNAAGGNGFPRRRS